MLDGLDEVARQEDRQSVVDWVDRQIARYPANDYVITSRPHGYQQYSLARATVLQVRRFTPVQIAQFVRGWYLAVERHSTGTVSEHVERKAQDEADDLLTRLGDTPALLDLAANPLLLTMIANVHRYRGALPGTRAELYAEMCLVLLGRRQQAKRLSDPLRAEQKEVVLRELAFIMMQEKVRDIPEDSLVDIIERVLPRVSGSLTSHDFLADIRANGLLLERERDVYCFAHHTFQEYLASAHIRDRGLRRVLEENVGDPWWRETILLYVARADAGPIIEACLGSRQLLALSLAFECSDAASELAPEMRSRLDALLSDAVEPDASPERRRLAATVISARQFRQAVRLEDGAQICSRPVSGDLYSLFVQDEIRAQRNRAPDSNEGTPLSDAVVGIRAGADATAFVEWLNQSLQGEGVCRLPTLTEARQMASTGNPTFMKYPVWVASGAADAPDLWVPPGRSHPYAVTFLELREQAHVGVREPIRLLLTSFLALSLAHTLAYAHTLALAINRDLMHDSYLFRDIGRNLNSVLTRGYNLNDHLNHVLGYDFVSALDTALDRIRRQVALLITGQVAHRSGDIARDLARDLARVRARTRELGYGLPLDDLNAHALGLDCDSFLELDVRTLDIERRLDLTDHDLDLELDHALNSASSYGGRESLLENYKPMNKIMDPSEFSWDLILSGPTHQLAQPSEYDFDLAMCMFLARSYPLITSIGGDSVEAWKRLENYAQLQDGKRAVLPDALYFQARHGYLHIIGKREKGGLGRRAANVATRVMDLASTVNNRVQDIKPYSASDILLGALAIAESADKIGLDEAVAHKYMDVAMCITALWRRMDSATKPDETIILVRV